MLANTTIVATASGPFSGRGASLVTDLIATSLLGPSPTRPDACRESTEAGLDRPAERAVVPSTGAPASDPDSIAFTSSPGANAAPTGEGATVAAPLGATAPGDCASPAPPCRATRTASSPPSTTGTGGAAAGVDGPTAAGPVGEARAVASSGASIGPVAPAGPGTVVPAEPGTVVGGPVGAAAAVVFDDVCRCEGAVVSELFVASVETDALAELLTKALLVKS